MTPTESIGVAILGSTGSIGRQALEVIAAAQPKFRVVALCAGSDEETLSEQVVRFRPRFAALRDPAAAGRLRQRGHRGVTIGAGPDALVEAATYDGVDVVLVSVVGFAGLLPTLRALESGRRVALANKETLVAAGELVMRAVARADAQAATPRLMPVDSEHSALFQTLVGRDRSHVARITLTASGGPFRLTPASELAHVTPEQALRHPTWRMGGKITIDSATLMNKGLEVIEAFHLFGVPLDRIDVVVHPQSAVHSIVEFQDGSLLAQMATADMRLPIAYALWYPEAAPRFVKRLDLTALGRLEFEPPDYERFPCLPLAVEACRRGKTYPTVLNAANEVAVYAFLEGRIAFTEIPRVIEAVLEAHDATTPTLDDVLAADAWARREASTWIERRGRAAGERIGP